MAQHASVNLAVRCFQSLATAGVSFREKGRESKYVLCRVQAGAFTGALNKRFLRTKEPPAARSDSEAISE